MKFDMTKAARLCYSWFWVSDMWQGGSNVLMGEPCGGCIPDPSVWWGALWRLYGCTWSVCLMGSLVEVVPVQSVWWGRLVEVLPEWFSRWGSLVEVVPDGSVWWGSLVEVEPYCSDWWGSLVEVVPDGSIWWGSLVEVVPWLHPKVRVWYRWTARGLCTVLQKICKFICNVCKGGCGGHLTLRKALSKPLWKMWESVVQTLVEVEEVCSGSAAQ